MTDAELMEQNLLAAADSGTDLREAVFAQFFAAYPDRRPLFYSEEAAQPRMTNETLDMLYGLATDEKWVWFQIAALVFNHRNYGDFALGEYEAFVDMLVRAVSMASGDSWSTAHEAAWVRQADKLKAMIQKAR
jgi:hypothetical protein